MSMRARRTWFPGLLLLLSVGSVGSATEHPAAVETLEVRETAGAIEFTISISEPVRYTYFELDGPRLVVDLHDTENRIGVQNTAVGKASVDGVRVASFSDGTRDVTRVVFDLEAQVPYDVVDDGEGRVRVRFGWNEPGAGSDLTTAAGLEAAPESLGVHEGDVEVQAIADTTSGSDTDPADLEKSPSQPWPAPQDGVATDGDSTASRPEFFTEAVGVPGDPNSASRVGDVALVASTAMAALPALPVPAAGSAQFARIEPAVASAPAGTPEVGILSPSAGILAEAPPAPPAEAPPAPPAEAPPAPPAEAPPASPARPLLTPPAQVDAPPTQYTGEVVTFNLVQSDLQDFFRVISELSGLNVIVDQDVGGALTMTLNEVPWDQALDLVLRTNNLGYELEGNILRVATQATLQAEEDARLALRDAQALNVPLETRPFILSYTNVGAVQPIIEPLLSARGEIIADPRRNALIISDVPSQFLQYESMIAFLDAPSPQVEIEARLMSVTKTFSREFGSQLALMLRNNQNPLGNNAVFNSDLAGFANGSVAFLLGAGGDVILDQVITMAESNGTGKLLSRPRVVTQNNIPATISQGTQIPVQTNVNNTISVEFIPFSLSLSVTPQITDAGTILLNATIENSTPDFGRAVGGVPSVATQSATTQVLIPDGGTAVVGGILTDSDSLNTSQIPGLGSIPVIGHLFKSTSVVKDTAELLFFITARIKPADPLEFLSGSTEGESELFGELQ